MPKSKEELLLSYKKANKETRARKLKKAGFATEAEYLVFLMKPDAVAEETDLLDQVIAFDTTGSMASYINAVRAHIKDLIPKLFNENKNLRIKIIAFGDYCDMPSPTSFGRAYQETQLTDNQNELIQFVNNAQNTSGGDGDEFYELVIKKVVEETPWRAGSKRAMLLIADANPHAIGYSFPNHSFGAPNAFRIKNNQIDWRQEAKNAAAINLQIDTLNCGRTYQETFYKPLSEITNGVNIPFSSSEKTQIAVYAATSVRGSRLSKAAFTSSMADAVEMGDEELIGTYKALRSKL